MINRFQSEDQGPPAIDVSDTPAKREKGCCDGSFGLLDTLREEEIGCKAG